MHHALEIYDIVRLILDYLSPKDHLRVVLVCKSVLEPALDLIWRNLNCGPAPLFRLWPGDAILNTSLPPHYMLQPEKYDILILTRKLLIHEWDRLVYHSKRVRNLEWNRSAPSIPGLVQQLTASLACPGSPPVLLPNLQSLVPHAQLQDVVTCQTLQHFISPSLQHISYHYSTYNFVDLLHPRFILQSLLATQPQLNSLGIAYGPTPTYSQHTIQILSAFSLSLQSVRLSTVRDWKLLEALGSLPNLRDLRIARYTPEDTEDLIKNLPAAWFPALRVIRSDAQVVLQILSSTNATPWITELAIENWSPLLIPDTVQRLIELIGSSCPSIHKLTFNGLERYDRERSVAQIYPVSIMPLKNCSNLRHLSIRSDGALKFPTDEEFAELLEAWPRLRHILIGIAKAPPLTLAIITLLGRRHASGQLDDYRIGPNYAH